MCVWGGGGASFFMCNGHYCSKNLTSIKSKNEEYHSAIHLSIHMNEMKIGVTVIV